MVGSVLVTESVAALPKWMMETMHNIFWIIHTFCTFLHVHTHGLLQLKNSTSLTANWNLLLNLSISTFLVLKLTLILRLSRPAGCSPGGTSATSTCGMLVVGASQTSKSSGTA